ncbi:hypothetical protein ARMSODRAFT_1065472 [Armillaria solidipes]|uniref:F-box domain-containing protein n=1 Tax=Armillaria solidipes TaxID=1076256 RepID=A0A2H3BB40_9AGAR|nr:hypothetical protein ARMSODRAFT_1065472 [Armillaria solidipes]
MKAWEIVTSVFSHRLDRPILSWLDMTSMDSTLCDLPDDVLIYTITFLSVPDIFLLRQTCKRFSALTRLWHILWTSTFKVDIVSNNYPFTLNDANLEHRTRQAYRRASRWLADSPLTPKSETTFIGSPVSEINVGIWSVLTNMGYRGWAKCSEWSPNGAIFTGVKLNADPESEAGIAVSLSQRIVLLRLDDDGTLDEIRSIDSDLCPVNITGDRDDVSKMLIYNWKTEERAYLDDVGDSQHDNCLEVVFTPSNILVVRARSITLYGIALTRIDTHSFGWDDSASATPISILIRSQHDNPWASKLNSLELYSLSSFPPTLSRKVSSRRGALRCTNVILGKRDTVIWICPHDRAMVSHGEKHDGYETLIAAVFPGPLNPSTEVHVREVCMNSLNNWTVLDYDEELGRIGLGSGFGKITIVQL